MALKKPAFSAGTVLITVFLVGLLIFVMWGAQAAWKLGGNTPMSIHGYIAVGLAFVLTAGLGGGLMWLAFYSARKGFDDDQEL